MNVFSSIVTSVLFVTHAYIFWSLRRMLGGGVWQLAFLLLFIGVMIIRFKRVYYLDHPRFLWVLDAFHYYLGFLVAATACLLAAEVVRLVLWAVGLAVGSNLVAWLAPAKIGIALWCLIVAVYVHGLHEARSVAVKRITVPTDLLPPGRERLRVVALTDIHLDRSIAAGELTGMVGLANAEDPDMTVLLGDIVDTDMRARDEERELLLSLKGPLGKFAVLGNHEAFSGIEQAADFLASAGFILLRGEARETAGIVVAGVDDPRTRGKWDSAELLRTVDRNKFVLLLSHRPLVPKEALGLFNLQLSGHTHGGQIFPGLLFSRLLNGYWQGLTNLSPGTAGNKRSLLYVSNGAGFWGPPVRLLARPEITVVDLVAK